MSEAYPLLIEKACPDCRRIIYVQVSDAAGAKHVRENQNFKCEPCADGVPRWWPMKHGDTCPCTNCT
jgi:hypothetical protein